MHCGCVLCVDSVVVLYEVEVRMNFGYKLY